MASIDDILPKLKDWLSTTGVKANVVVTKQDTIEIRMFQEDLIATMFPTKYVRPTNIKTHAAPVEHKKKKEPTLDLKRGGFNIKLASASEGLSDAERAYLYSLCNGKYSFLSATRLNGKVWDNTCREVLWLASNIFVDSHRWDKNWISRTSSKGGGPSLLKGIFKDVPMALKAITDCLDYIKDSQAYGSYWWPPLENGKRPRKSLQSFLVSTMRSGMEWSPFVEVYWDLHKDMAIKSKIPESIIKIADDIIKSSPYISGLSRQAMYSFWEGVLKYIDWYKHSKETLMQSSKNRVRFADVSMAMDMVKDWNETCGGRVLPANFIFPGSTRWVRFAKWCNTERGLMLPEDS